jgi:hypothetical protein
MSTLEDLRLVLEDAPAIMRSGGGGAPIEWEKLIGPVISQNIDKDVLIQVFPKEGLPANDQERAAARRQAASRAGMISTRYYKHVPNEYIETKVRLRPEGNYGVYAVHHGPMTDEIRARLAARRAPRAPAGPGSTESPANPGPSTNAPAAGSEPQTAAERVRAAAKKQA